MKAATLGQGLCRVSEKCPAISSYTEWTSCCSSRLAVSSTSLRSSAPTSSSFSQPPPAASPGLRALTLSQKFGKSQPQEPRKVFLVTEVRYYLAHSARADLKVRETRVSLLTRVRPARAEAGSSTRTASVSWCRGVMP